jgi:hypothetical protein
MADQIQQPWPATGATLYAIIRDAAAQAADVVAEAWEAYATATRGDYDITLTEQGTASLHYAAAFPSWIAAGRYLICVHEQAGGSPAESDSLLASDWYDWDGSNLGKVSLVADQSAVTVGTVSTLTGHTAQTADHTAQLTAIVTDTNELQSDDVPGLIAALNDLSAAEVNAEVDTAIETYKLDHLVAVADSDDPVNNSIIAKLASSDGDWSGFSNTTDALEALQELVAGLNDLSVSDVLTTQMTESYAANGVSPTLAQSLFAIHQMLMQFAISGTSISVKKLDDSTQAFVVTLDDGTDPTSARRQ